MSYFALGLSMALIAYGASVSALTLFTAPWIWIAMRVSDPAGRARALIVLRFLPSVLGFLVVGLVFLPAFLRHEPRETTESVSAAMFALAGAAGVILLAGPMRGLLSLVTTRSLVKRWRRNARPIDVPGIALPSFLVEVEFPLMSLAGVLRPRLYIARSVLERCDRGELAAVVAHEAGHLRRRDHWIRPLFRFCPDVLSVTPAGDRIERAWVEAAEQLADDHAARSRPGAALDLASALIKVARLVGSAKAPSPSNVPLLALYRGEGVAGRVARLLDREEAPSEPRRRSSIPAVLTTLAAIPVFFLVAAHEGLFRHVHALIESAVAFLQ